MVTAGGGMRSWVRGFFYLTIMAQLLAPVFDRYHAPDTSATRTRLRWELSVHQAARDALAVYTYTCSLKLVVLLLHASIRYHWIGGRLDAWRVSWRASNKKKIGNLSHPIPFIAKSHQNHSFLARKHLAKLFYLIHCIKMDLWLNRHMKTFLNWILIWITH